MRWLGRGVERNHRSMYGPRLYGVFGQLAFFLDWINQQERIIRNLFAFHRAVQLNRIVKIEFVAANLFDFFSRMPSKMIQVDISANFLL